MAGLSRIVRTAIWATVGMAAASACLAVWVMWFHAVLPLIPSQQRALRATVESAKRIEIQQYGNPWTTLVITNATVKEWFGGRKTLRWQSFNCVCRASTDVRFIDDEGRTNIARVTEEYIEFSGPWADRVVFRSFQAVTPRELLDLMEEYEQELRKNDQPTSDENKLLTLVLKGPRADGRYIVVYPDTGLWHVDTTDANKIRKMKRFLTENFQTNGAVVAKLVDSFCERNKKPVRLTIESSLKDGYVIDYDGAYTKYFEKGGGGWDTWYKEHPKAHGIARISLPVYDPETGLVLVYIGITSHWLSGSGWVTLYKYENGELIEIGTLRIWVS